MQTHADAGGARGQFAVVVICLGGDGVLRVKVAGDSLWLQRQLRLRCCVFGLLRGLCHHHGHHLPHIGHGVLCEQFKLYLVRQGEQGVDVRQPVLTQICGGQDGVHPWHF